jgi:hypothetical protein
VPNLIITGIPRSGTTLAAAIVDQSPDALCLSEPDHHVDLMNGAATAAEFVRQLCLDFDAIRRTILAGGFVLDRRCPDGTPVTNYFTSNMLDGRRKPAFVIRGITRPALSPDFVLGVKHNALYSAVLPEIVQSGCFRVVAIIRDPVAVLKSWRSLDLPISRGRLPAGERFWPELHALGRADLDLTDKQIRICDLLLGRFEHFADRIVVVPYEVFVTDPARLLAAAAIPISTSSQVDAVRRRMPTSEHADQDTAVLIHRIRQLAELGQVPSIARYYRYAAAAATTDQTNQALI